MVGGHLRSVSSEQLFVPRHYLSTFGRRTFSVSVHWPEMLLLMTSVIRHKAPPVSVLH